MKISTKIKNIAVISLGCDKNRVDTENMLYYLAGKNLTVTDDYAAADAIIVNTCAFIESARKEAIDTVLEMAQYKSGNCSKLIVTGCLPQKYRDELAEALPEADAFLGIDEYEKIYGVLTGDENFVCPSVKYGRVLTTPAHYAYLKISDGCDNHCTFCLIPSIRGRFRSRTIESLKEEAQILAEQGVKELILVAQDVTRYGEDIYGKPSLVALLKALEATPVEYIRLMYCYPELVDDALIDYIASSSKVLHYIDIPLQHIDSEVLKRMGRRSNRDSVCALLDKLKGKIPDISLRTTFMVGFPGETESQFESLCDFVKRYRPDHTGIFAYSKEKDTPSYKLKGHIPKREKMRRVGILGEIVLDIAKQKNAAMTGKIADVVYEDIDYERGMFVGRRLSDAPEIDSRVYFTGGFADVGKVYKVKITGFEDYDLTGEMTE